LKFKFDDDESSFPNQFMQLEPRNRTESSDDWERFCGIAILGGKTRRFWRIPKFVWKLRKIFRDKKERENEKEKFRERKWILEREEGPLRCDIRKQYSEIYRVCSKSSSFVPSKLHRPVHALERVRRELPIKFNTCFSFRIVWNARKGFWACRLGKINFK